MALRLGANKTKEINYSSVKLDVISFVLFPQASEPSWNFNISKIPTAVREMTQHGLLPLGEVRPDARERRKSILLRDGPLEK